MAPASAPPHEHDEVWQVARALKVLTPAGFELPQAEMHALSFAPHPSTQLTMAMQEAFAPHADACEQHVVMRQVF
jgi:hypothetical protein